MSTTIDQRVVEMRFDNSNFENNVKTSMSTLEKLKRALKFDGASKGLENIQSTANKVNFSGMSRGIDTMTQKFSYMQMTIQHQLNNIVDSAVNAGKRMVSALTIDPVKSGLQEYETQINSVQTILANTQHNGTTLDEVNSALDTLNTYADKTIYNFTEMTRNIGTFTAAGVDLQTSVDSIQGIANLAAVSGSNAQQASTAMYQLSQALAAGKVSLMDWNSVVNAGMGGKVFQDALIRTSELLKTGAKDAIAANGSFRESLTKSGWLTTEVLTETLKQFAGAYSEAELIAQGFTEKQAKEIAAMAETATNAATKVKTFTQLWDTLKEAAQSGWTQTWELIIGDFDEAKELLTSISDTVGNFIGKMSDSRNNLLGGALKSPWKKFIEECSEAGVSATDLETKVKDLYEAAKGEGAFDTLVKNHGSFQKACRDGAISSDMLKKAVKELAGGFTDLSDVQKNLKFGDQGEDVKKVQQALKNLGYEFEKYGVDGIIGEETEGIIKKFQEMNNLEVDGIVGEETLKALEEANKNSGKFKGNLDELIESLDEMGGREKIIESFKNIFKGLGDLIRPVKMAFDKIIPKTTSEDLSRMIDNFYELTQKIKVTDETAAKIYNTFKGVFSIIHLVSMVTGGALRTAFAIGSKVLGVFGLSILDVTSAIGKIVTAIHDWITQESLIAKFFDSIIAKIPQVVDGLKTWFEAFKQTESVQRFVELTEKVKKSFKALATMQFNADSISHWLTELKENVVELAKSIPAIFKQLISDIVSGIDGLTGGAVTKLKKFLTMFAVTPEMEAFAQALHRLWSGLEEMLSGIGDLAGGLLEKATSMGRNIIEGLQNGLSDGSGNVVSKILEVATNLINAFCDMLGIHSPSTVAFEWGQNIIQGLVNGIKAAIGMIVDAGKSIAETIKGYAEPLYEATKETISNFTEKAIQFSSKIDWNKVLTGGMLIGSFATIFKICNTLQALAKPLTSISTVIESFAGTIETVGKAQAKNLNREALMKTAIAIGVLVAAIAALVYVAGDNYLQIWNAVGVVAALAAVLVGLSIAMDKLGSASLQFEKGKLNIDGIKQSLISVGIAILLLGITAKLISGMNKKEFEQGFKGLGVIMLSVLGFIAICSKIAKSGEKDISAFGKTMKKIAVAMLLMLAVIKIASMMDPGDLAIGFVVIELFALIALQMAWANRIAGTEAAKFGSTMTKMAVAMSLMLGVIWIISKMDLADIVIGIIVIEAFTLIIRQMAWTNRKAGTEATEFGGTMVKMAFAMALMVGVVKLLSMMNPNEIIRGVLAMQAFVLVIAEMLLIAKLGSKVENIGSTVIGMALAVGILAGVCVLISMIDVTQLAKGLVAVGILSAFMTAMIWAARGVQASMGSLIALSVAVGIMAVAVAGLTLIDPGKLYGAVGALAILMTVFGLMTKLASGAKASIGALISIMAVVVLLTGLLWAIDILDIKGSIETVASLSILLLAMAASLNIMNGVTEVSKGAFKAMFVLALVIAVLGAVLGIMNGLHVEASIPTAIALSILLLAMAGVTKILSLIGPVASSAVTGAIGLVGVVAVIGGLMIALGALVNLFPEVQQFVDTGIPLLVSIGEGIGRFIGAFIGGIGTGICEQLPRMSECISEFVNNFTGIDSSAVDGVKSFAEVIAAIGSAAIVDGIAGVLNFSEETPIEQFKQNALDLVSAIKEISESLNGVTINDTAIESVAKAGTMFTTLANSIPPTDGLLQKLTGVSNLAGFGAQIKVYTDEILKVNEAVSGKDFTFNSDTIQAIADAGTSFSKLANSIPTNVEGIVQKITGAKSLGNFGTDIGKYVDELLKINESISGENFSFNSDVIASIASAGTGFAKLINSIPANVEGWAQKIAGTKSLGTFGTDIGKYVGEMKKVGESIGSDFSFNTDAIGTLKTAGEKMAELQDSLPKVGGVISWFVGRTDLGDFGVKIGKFAEAMGKLKSGMGENGISDAVVESVKKAGDALIALNDSLPSEGWFDGKISMSDFADYISDFSEAISDFSADASSINPEAIDVAITAANRIKFLISAISNLDTSGVANFTGIGTGGLGADGVVSDIAEAIVGFSEKVAGIDIAAVNTSVSAASRLRTLISNLTGLDASGIENFKPASIGSAIKSYANKVTGLDTAVVSTSVTVAYRLKSLIASLTGLDSSGISNFKAGSVGSAIKAFSTNVKGVDMSSVNLSISAATRVKNFISGLASLDTSGVASFSKTITSLGKINLEEAVSALNVSTSKFENVGANLINALNSGLKAKSGTVKSTMSIVVTSILNSINVKRSIFNTAGSQLMSQLNNGIRSKTSSVKATVTTMVTSILNTFQSKNSTFNKAGASLIENLIKGINSKRGSTSTAVRTLASNASSAISNSYQSFYRGGKYLGEGLVLGIESKKQAAYDAGYALGQAAAKGEKDGQDSNSPSKLTIKYGKWFGEGLVIGIESFTKKVYNAGGSLGETAVDSMSSAISKATDYISGNIDANPTIRPIMDLADIEDGVGAINGMIGNNLTIGASANLGAISSMMSKRSQNGTNADVVTAINGLKKSIGKLRSSTYNINGITYDDGSNITEAVETLVRAARIERRR